MSARIVRLAVVAASVFGVALSVAGIAHASTGTLAQPYHGAGRFRMHIVKPCAGFSDLEEPVTIDIAHDRMRMDIVGIPLLVGPVSGLRFDVEDGSTFRVRGVFVDGPTQHATFLVYLAGCVGRGDVTIDGLDPPISVAVPTTSPSATPSTSTPTPTPIETEPPVEGSTASSTPFVVLIVIGVVLVLAGMALLLAYRRTLPPIEEVARQVIAADPSTGGKHKRKGRGKDRAADG